MIKGLALVALSTFAAVSTALYIPSNPIQWLNAKRVILISVDGFHASDLVWWTTNYPNSAISAIASRSLVYTQASSSIPSDSFPGLLAFLTGGSPKTHGVWYDDSYDPTLYPPGSNCTGDVGSEVIYDEGIDKNASDISTTIDPKLLPMQLKDGKCTPLYPHSFVRTNNIFELAKSKGLTTGWADKHPSYELVQGPSGTGVDDLFTPEIAAVSKTLNATRDYDQTHIKAVVNWINGVSSDGKTKLPAIPSVFGCNLQTVSVVQKNVGQGYTNASTPSPTLVQAFTVVDGFMQQIVDALVAAGLFDSTMLIISAKHGQSPIDPTKLSIVTPGNLTQAIGVPVAHIIADSAPYIWLKNSSDANTAASNLYKNAAQAKSVYLLTKEGLVAAGMANANDPRVPDIMLQPKIGTVYTGVPSKKIAEHGSANEDDTHVALIVSHSWIKGPVMIDNPVETKQVAHTIALALGLDPNGLQAVVAENTQPLPGVKFLVG